MEDPVKAASPGEVWAYIGVCVGLAVSVAANVVHAADDPKATGFALILAAFWPLCLFLAIEVLARTTWADGWQVKLARAAVVLVAAVAAVVSYLHLHGLLIKVGEDALPALLGPLAIDGLMAVCAAALLNKAPKDAPEPEPDPEPDPEPPAATTTVPEPAKRAPVKRNVNGRDLRVTEAKRMIEAARGATPPQPDPTVNAIATALGVTWKTAQPIHAKALTEIGGHR